METLYNELLTVKVNSFGAELSSISNNNTGQEYVWQADPAFWKRHSPVLFPIVGGLRNNEYRNDGIPYTMTQHGFARDMNFELLYNKPDEVFYQLESNSETLSKYPFPFLLKIGYRLAENKIEVLWEVKNTGVSTMYFQIGAHPAFNYPDFNTSDNIKGYFSFDKKEGLEYVLISEKGGIPPGPYIPLKLDDGLLPIGLHTFDKDALIFEESQISTVNLLDKNKQPYISLHFEAPLVGLWSPPAKNAPFVCIEPWYGRGDSVDYSGEFKDKDWMNSLEPDDIFSASYTIEIRT